MCALADDSTKSSVVLDHELDPREEPRSFKNHDMKVTALVTETQDCRIFRFNEGADQFAGAAAAFVTVGTEIVAVSGLVQLGFPLSICNRFIVTFSLPCSTSTSRK